MTEQNYLYEPKTTLDGSPIKHWTKGVAFDKKAHEQLREVAALPFIHRHVAAMPDVHWGYGIPRRYSHTDAECHHSSSIWKYV